MEPKTVIFDNEKHESFSLSVFQPPLTTFSIDGHATPLPVLFCVHGAGMSGASFYRLARHLVSGPEHVSAAPGESACVESQDAVSPSESSSPLARPPPVAGMPPLPGRTLPPTSRASATAVHSLAPSTHASDVAGCPPGLVINPLDAPIGDHVNMCVVTYDLRCHGNSTFAGGEESLTLDVLVNDFKAVLQYTKSTLFPGHQFFVLGHSVGGSIVAHGLQNDKGALDGVGGVILVDAVEGTAKLSLAHMGDFLARRPAMFDNVNQAEKWFLTSGGMRSPAGAAVSVPPLLKRRHDGRYEWKTDLNRTAPVWGTWFDGSDQAFISLPISKMLCLANAERLDTAMTVAQMQGKFQFEIIGNDCGHYVMDDATATLASKIQRFAKRILVLTQKLNSQVKPGIPLHFNNATVPPNRSA